jgi:hypothetical protein
MLYLFYVYTPDGGLQIYSVIVTVEWLLYCEVLKVILTPTCRVSGYPRQVIIVDAA